ncbi:MAG TPA: DUF3189 family protein [Bacillus sp. (in: firmicutes)]|uniref:DUF3189 family protein n=1 Tax=Bacillus litorisediminis TaxID=2922713 RepID=UPI001FAC7A9E|nr:DUF3189 family protein [Bacillus litorisediminis]HWO78389.1 DUF3189 family protein [Bacillus sp. (in: firmicutes)]
MIYIYHDFGGTHTTSMAAAYHLKILLPSSKILSKEEILSIPYFNKLNKQDAGKLIFHGNDEEGHPVYTIGRRSNKYVVPALKNMSLLLQEKFNFEERIIFSNTSPTVPLPMTIGGFLSRELGIDSIGVPLLVKGAQICSQHIYQLVEQTKKIAHEKHEQTVIVIENQSFQI